MAVTNNASTLYNGQTVTQAILTVSSVHISALFVGAKTN